ncbi:hypothetical protein QZH41_010088 [Actinostola sp. cb2023]|nr:hypothetical protein QZH41_010088 [Actinostola sp. cb2023]
MADSADSKMAKTKDAESELNKADSTHEELEILDKMSTEIGEDDTEASNKCSSRFAEGETEILESGANLSSTGEISSSADQKSSESPENTSESTSKVGENRVNGDGIDDKGENMNDNAQHFEKEEGNSVISDTNDECLQRDISASSNSNALSENWDKEIESQDVVAQPDIRSTNEREVMQSLYHIKWMKWKNINTPIITQNENGPCPLIAIMNALILQRKISIPSMQEIVSANQLMEYLGDCILDQVPERLPEGAQLNYEQNMADAIGIMSKLQTGLDVNVQFTGVADFEFTPECVVFDLLNIRLMHGWLVDPQNHEAVEAIGNLSYNQLVEKIIASKQEGADPDVVTVGLVAEAFLDQSAAQLTYHGLYELSAQMGEEELCTFFRNNHFNTLFKHKNELFLLVTDQGFLTEDQVMWETLSNVEGDGYFVDANFRTIPPSQPPPPPVPNMTPKLSSSTGISQEDQDYLVALSLQEEQTKIDARERETREKETSTVATHPEPSAGMTSQEWSE